MQQSRASAQQVCLNPGLGLSVVGPSALPALDLPLTYREKLPSSQHLVLAWAFSLPGSCAQSWVSWIADLERWLRVR
jgi:hypothetical protein